jgi:hypothetical protein
MTDAERHPLRWILEVADARVADASPRVRTVNLKFTRRTFDMWRAGARAALRAQEEAGEPCRECGRITHTAECSQGPLVQYGVRPTAPTGAEYAEWHAMQARDMRLAAPTGAEQELLPSPFIERAVQIAERSAQGYDLRIPMTALEATVVRLALRAAQEPTEGRRT